MSLIVWFIYIIAIIITWCTVLTIVKKDVEEENALKREPTPETPKKSILRSDLIQLMRCGACGRIRKNTSDNFCMQCGTTLEHNNGYLSFNHRRIKK